MRWMAPVLGVATVALGVSVAEAKMVRYEVNGQRFLFSTKDRAQFELARQRINAANAAVAARAKANAELAANPLVRAFGSQSQNEAKAAEANLARVLATAPRHEQTPVVTGRSSSRRTPQSPLPTANSREPVRQASRAISTAAVDQELVRPPGSEPKLVEPTSSPKVEAIVFDFASKIRTVLRTNGTVEEEPFESAVAEKLKRAKRPGGPEIKFVNEDATNQD
jgi:hypothetical protein